jgi:hypothetical protein
MEAAFDPIRRSVVMFGGQDAQGRTLDDTWLWDGHEWTKVPTSNRPPARTAQAMGTDWVSGRVFLFGGTDLQNVLGDTWMWTGTDWVQISGPGPSARSGCGQLAYDVRNNGLLLFGGWDDGQQRDVNDTWLLDASGWRQLLASSPVGGREDHVTITDGSSGDVHVYGGYSNSFFPNNELWRWQGSTWSRVYAATPPPPPRGGMRGVWDGRQCLFTGGHGQSIWSFDGASWRMVDEPGGPTVAGLVYESARDTILILEAVYPAGSPARASVYRNGQQIQLHDLPFTFVGPSVHHTASGLTMVFAGGSGAGVWLYDGRAWTRDVHPVDPEAVPSVSYYDAHRQKIVCVSHATRRFYSWDPTSGWARSSWTGGPITQPLVFGYDTERGRYVVFTQPQGEVWEWDVFSGIMSRPLLRLHRF